MIGKLNHVGIAVPNLAAAIENYQRLYGVDDAAITHIGPMPDHGVEVAFINLAAGQLELLAPFGEKSPILGFLAKNPHGGQHHICFEVDDVVAASAHLAAKGATILGNPRIGAHGTLVVFIHPKDNIGVLIELMNRPDNSAH